MERDLEALLLHIITSIPGPNTNLLSSAATTPSPHPRNFIHLLTDDAPLMLQPAPRARKIRSLKFLEHPSRKTSFAISGILSLVARDIVIVQRLEVYI